MGRHRSCLPWWQLELQSLHGIRTKDLQWLAPGVTTEAKNLSLGSMAETPFAPTREVSTALHRALPRSWGNPEPGLLKKTPTPRSALTLLLVWAVTAVHNAGQVII